MKSNSRLRNDNPVIKVLHVNKLRIRKHMMMIGYKDSRLHLSLFLLFFVFIANGYAQEEKYIGLFVYNFTKYFDWPESAKTGDFKIIVLGHPSVYEELTRLCAGKKVGTQNIIIKNVNTAEEVGNCNILFVGHWHSRLLPDIITKMGNQPTLLITEMEGMLDKGSAINFVIRDGTIKFELKSSNLQSHNLKTDQRIRELAYKVID